MPPKRPLLLTISDDESTDSPQASETQVSKRKKATMAERHPDKSNDEILSMFEHVYTYNISSFYRVTECKVELNVLQALPTTATHNYRRWGCHVQVCVHEVCSNS